MSLIYHSTDCLLLACRWDLTNQVWSTPLTNENPTLCMTLSKLCLTHRTTLDAFDQPLCDQPLWNSIPLAGLQEGQVNGV